MDGGAWWAAVYGVPQSWTQLKRLSSSSINSIEMRSLIKDCCGDSMVKNLPANAGDAGSAHLFCILLTFIP